MSLLLIVLLVRAPNFILPIDNDTGAIAYHARLINQGEPLYSSHHPGHHLPAIYYTYALIFNLLGDHPNSLQLFLIFWMWVNGIILYKIGESNSSKISGVLSAILYVVISSMTNINGDTAEIELFANVPISIVILLGTYLWTTKKNTYLLLIGVFSGLSVLFKAVYFASFLAVCLVMFYELVTSNNLKSIVIFLKQLVYIMLGILFVFGLVILFFSKENLLQRFFLVFQSGSVYLKFNNSPWYYIILVPFILLININLSMVFFGLVSVIRSIFYIFMKKNNREKITPVKVLLLGWLFFSVISAGFSRFGFPHYMILIIPPLSLLVSIEIEDVWKLAKTSSINIPNSLKILLPLILLMVVISNIFYSSYSYIDGFIKYRLNKIGYIDFVENHTTMGKVNILAENIANYIKENSDEDDLIFTWTELAQINYLSGRHSSSDVIWPLYVTFFGPPERVFEEKPLYIVYGPHFFYEEESPNWLINELNENYHLEISIDFYKIYRLNSITG